MTLNHQLVYKYRRCLCLEFICFYIKSADIGRLSALLDKPNEQLSQ